MFFTPSKYRFLYEEVPLTIFFEKKVTEKSWQDYPNAASITVTVGKGDFIQELAAEGLEPR